MLEVTPDKHAISAVVIVVIAGLLSVGCIVIRDPLRVTESLKAALEKKVAESLKAALEKKVVPPEILLADDTS